MFVVVGESTTVRPLITASPGIVSSTLASASNITVTPTINSTAVPASTTTTSKPLTSSKGTTPGSTPASTTTKPTLAPNSSIVTTSAPHHERKFDGPSFVGERAACHDVDCSKSERSISTGSTTGSPVVFMRPGRAHALGVGGASMVLVHTLFAAKRVSNLD
ncbi:hypothetical protein HUJ05_000860 [Dendroctonus ponderosae]|nr:hypothetical protein HUJ05_000860 [Dendroctonus ponderosae]